MLCLLQRKLWSALSLTWSSWSYLRWRFRAGGDDWSSSSLLELELDSELELELDSELELGLDSELELGLESSWMLRLLLSALLCWGRFGKTFLEFDVAASAADWATIDSS
jgi:hypothetical protein